MPLTISADISLLLVFPFTLVSRSCGRMHSSGWSISVCRWFHLSATESGVSLSTMRTLFCLNSPLCQPKPQYSPVLLRRRTTVNDAEETGASPWLLGPVKSSGTQPSKVAAPSLADGRFACVKPSWTGPTASSPKGPPPSTSCRAGSTSGSTGTASGSPPTSWFRHWAAQSSAESWIASASATDSLQRVSRTHRCNSSMLLSLEADACRSAPRETSQPQDICTLRSLNGPASSSS
mmetsp:Transcript_86345/g.241471  ORF Transcript_86345/g.241471 Transcript_86345/m.241471 type:complete len:235 (-) Transcript_86345:541-1245(-)